MNAFKIAAAFGSARREGRRWRTCCPIHGGHSLVVTDGCDGRLLLRCWGGGCDPRDILAELRRRGLIGDAVHDRHRPSLATTRPDERDDAAHRIAMAQRIWDAAQDARGTHVVPYFAGRLITPFPRRLCCATRPRCAAQTAAMGRRWLRA